MRHNSYEWNLSKKVQTYLRKYKHTFDKLKSAWNYISDFFLFYQDK